jgi:hypothetical protein
LTFTESSVLDREICTPRMQSFISSLLKRN